MHADYCAKVGLNVTNNIQIIYQLFLHTGVSIMGERIRVHHPLNRMIEPLWSFQGERIVSMLCKKIKLRKLKHLNSLSGSSHWKIISWNSFPHGVFQKFSIFYLFIHFFNCCFKILEFQEHLFSATSLDDCFWRLVCNK